MEHAEIRPIAPRDPATVMTLARMGSFHQSRLSFMRILLRRLKSEAWTFKRPVFDIGACGVGVAVYTAKGPERCYSLICFANDLPPEKRSDRVIATEWDATFTLFDGVPETADIERLAGNVPKQEAGRVSATELTLSRANRSVRLWDHVVESLADGRQPDAAKVAEVGYLMRTTAVYGSGKFGAADREMIAQRPEFQAPFQVEMLTVFLIRGFVMDLVEHMAEVRAPGRAALLDAGLRRRFGIGNSTGLGMAPFLINHPMLLNNWIAAKEEALARVRSVAEASPDEITLFQSLARRARINAHNWHSAHSLQIEKLADLRKDMDLLAHRLEGDALTGSLPWDALWRWGDTALSLEGQEQMASLLLEPYGELVDELSATMAADEAVTSRIDGAMPLGRMRRLCEDIYGWALEIDWNDPAASEAVWYVSEEKLEPRLGNRRKDGVEPYEQPLCPGRDAMRMYRDIVKSEAATLAEFLVRHPEHRHIARRAQIAARYPYAEIRDNTIAADMLPIDLLRAKLSFFGACHFDPRSDRWVRINMFQHAPLPGELSDLDSDDWTLPPEGKP